MILNKIDSISDKSKKLFSKILNTTIFIDRYWVDDIKIFDLNILIQDIAAIMATASDWGVRIYAKDIVDVTKIFNDTFREKNFESVSSALNKDMHNLGKDYYFELLPLLHEIFDINQFFEEISQFPGINSKANGVIVMPRFGESAKQVLAIWAEIKLPYGLEQYKQTLDYMNKIKQDYIDNMDTKQLMPRERKLLEALPFIPKETLPYLSRGQAIDLLNKFEIGITLEKKFLEAKQTQNPS